MPRQLRRSALYSVGGHPKDAPRFESLALGVGWCSLDRSNVSLRTIMKSTFTLIAGAGALAVLLSGCGPATQHVYSASYQQQEQRQTASNCHPYYGCGAGVYRPGYAVSPVYSLAPAYSYAPVYGAPLYPTAGVCGPGVFHAGCGAAHSISRHYVWP